jgi:cytochrome P450
VRARRCCCATRRRSCRLPARELVSTFGDGRHACPAQRFSITAIRVSLRRLFARFEVTPRLGFTPTFAAMAAPSQTSGFT